MNPISLGADAFRVAARFIIPGTLAASPYLWVVYQAFPRFEEFTVRNDIASGLIVLFSCITMSFVTEKLADALEEHSISQPFRDPKSYLYDKYFDHNWRNYLTRWIPGELIAGKYISSQVLRMKFALGVSVALCLSAPGYIVLSRTYGESATYIASEVFFFVFFFVVFFREAFFCQGYLAGIRSRLDGGMRWPPDNEVCERCAALTEELDKFYSRHWIVLYPIFRIYCHMRVQATLFFRKRGWRYYVFFRSPFYDWERTGFVPSLDDRKLETPPPPMDMSC
jgi:hypothetical protein